MHNPRYDGRAAANDCGKVEISPASKRNKENDGERDGCADETKKARPPEHTKQAARDQQTNQDDGDVLHARNAA
jgi:hypothetical protein